MRLALGQVREVVAGGNNRVGQTLSLPASAQLARLPDLGKALRGASPEIKRQVFESFDLQIAYDKAERRVELTATVSEAVADAFENAKALQAQGCLVVARDIAGARFVSRYDARIVERVRLTA